MFSGRVVPFQLSSSNETLGHQALLRRGLNFGEHFYWISVAALMGMWVLVNTAFTLALTYSKRKFDFMWFQEENDKN